MWPSSLFILNHEKKGFNLHFVGIFRNQSRHTSLSSSVVKAPALSTNMIYMHVSQKSPKKARKIGSHYTGWITCNCLVTIILNEATGLPIT